MTHFHGPLPSFLGVRLALVVVALMAGLLFCQTALAADIAFFEAESMKYGTFASAVTSSGASGGQALRYENDGTATKSITTTQGAAQVVVRARNSDYSLGTYQSVGVTVDGVDKGKQQLRSRVYEDYAFNVTIPAGTHTIGVVGSSLESEDAMLADTVRLVAPDAPSSSGAVRWKADAESTLDKEWAELSTDTHCAVTTAPGMTDPRFYQTTTHAQGTQAWKSSLVDGDACYGERAEAGQANPTRPDMLDRLFREGEERWISFQTRLENGFPVNPGTWQVLMQLKQTGAYGSPIMALHVERGRWELHRTTNDPNNQRPSDFQGTFPFDSAQTGVWTKWTWHVKFSPDPAVGFLEVYGDLADGQGMRLLFRENMSTMKIANDTGKVLNTHSRIGIYRDSKIAGNAAAYYDGWTVADTRAAAEANAFGG
ncbi:MAG: heparin lyase I family protein [Rubrobacter sp.]|nr:heparin lyase I family protein [Rubrobacter sp.]